MPKKKTKEKAVKKKVTKKKTTGKKRDPLKQLPLTLRQKMHEVARENPQFSGRGDGQDADGGIYTYTLAEDIFAAYAKSHEKWRIRLFQIDMTWEHIGRGIFVVVSTQRYCDIDSDEYIDITVAGESYAGGGLLSAQTLARKYNLLFTYDAAWPQPIEQQKVMKAQASEVLGKSEKLGDILSAVDQMKVYFGGKFDEIKKNKKS